MRAASVALVVHRYAPAIGGVERNVEGLARGLAQRGVGVEVITTDPTGLLPPVEERDGVLVRRFPTVAGDSVYYVAPRLGAWLRRNAARFALIHAHSYHTPLALQAALAAALAGRPFLLSPYYHGTGHSPLRRALHVPYRLAGRWLVGQARRLVYISETERALLEQHFGGGRPALVAPCGVEIEQLLDAQPHAKPFGRRTILAVGRLEAYKQTDRLIQALPLLPREYEVVVIGSGPLRPRIEQLAAQLGQRERVRLLDHLPEPELLAWYRSADVFVSLSRRESFGLTVLEAAVAGAALVASDIPAHREVGGFIPADRMIFVDPDCLAGDLGRAIELAARRGRASGVAGWRLPTWDAMVDAVAGCYRDVLRRGLGSHATQQLKSGQIGIAAGARPLAQLADTAPAAASWGWLPTLSLAGAAGLLLLALANNGARTAAAWSGALFWAGLLLLFVPVAARLFAAAPARRERIGLVLMLGCGLYIVKLLHSPLAFTFSDELQHWRTADDLLRGGYLFGENPLLPVSPLYPGLESVTVALAEMSGLSLFAAGALAIGAARLVAALALYLLYEQVGRSARLAGIAALLYMANPNYLFFDAQFAYESLALPLAALVLFAAARRGEAASDERVGLTMAIALGLAGVVITHHVTTYALTAFLALWALVASIRATDRRAPLHPRGLALLALVAGLTWLAYAATLTASYLFPQLSGSLAQLLQLIAGDAVGRELFRSPAGQLSPLWERLAGYAAVALILLGLPLGLRQIWRARRDSTAALALAAGALAYPLSLALRLTDRGAEAANRGAAFLFVAIAFVLAAWAAELPLAGRGRNRPAGADEGRRTKDDGVDRTIYRLSSIVFRLNSFRLVALATVIFVGGVAVGWPPPWARLPRPYLPAADTRSIEGQGLAAASWMRESLGPGNRLIADRTSRLLMGAYGEQRPVTSYADKVKSAQVFLAPSIGPVERQILARGQVRYLVVDRRLSAALPSTGFYFERGEIAGDQYTAPIDPAALAKFDQLEQASRLFDSGDIVIYDVGRLR